MKYIKKYEDSNALFGYDSENSVLKYKEGDYVLINIKLIQMSNSYLDNNKIVQDDMAQIIDTSKKMLSYPYKIIFYNNNTEQVAESEIIRLLTIEEIEVFKAKKESTKYNI